MTVKLIPPASEYARVFADECARTYPQIDAMENRAGHALNREDLEAAARVLACPVKAHDPNWQHGRVIYALALKYLASASAPVLLFDLGTAKGFSALCLESARLTAGVAGQVVSVDVIDPASHARRNTVAECDGLKTLYEILAPWPEASAIQFLHKTGIDWLTSSSDRVHVAFIDGKHDREVVRREGELLAARQESGDLAIFDDCQIPGVQKAVNALGEFYAFEPVTVTPERAYAIGVRR